MAKKTANQAIDFARLFAVKQQLQAEPLTPPLADAEPELDDRAASVAPALEAIPDSMPVNEVEAAVDLTMAEKPAEVKPEARTIPLPPVESATRSAQETSPPEIYLRVGLPRRLHERLRAYAALQGQSVTSVARELLATTPALDPAAPMATLASIAQGAFVATPTGRVDVRMQVPLTIALHRRLQQIAALRAQTLSACLIEFFEARVPTM